MKLIVIKVRRKKGAWFSKWGLSVIMITRRLEKSRRKKKSIIYC